VHLCAPNRCNSDEFQWQIIPRLLRTSSHARCPFRWRVRLDVDWAKFADLSNCENERQKCCLDDGGCTNDQTLCPASEWTASIFEIFNSTLRNVVDFIQQLRSVVPLGQLDLFKAPVMTPIYPRVRLILSTVSIPSSPCASGRSLITGRRMGDTLPAMPNVLSHARQVGLFL